MVAAESERTAGAEASAGPDAKEKRVGGLEYHRRGVAAEVGPGKMSLLGAMGAHEKMASGRKDLQSACTQAIYITMVRITEGETYLRDREEAAAAVHAEAMGPLLTDNYLSAWFNITPWRLHTWGTKAVQLSPTALSMGQLVGPGVTGWGSGSGIQAISGNGAWNVPTFGIEPNTGSWDNSGWGWAGRVTGRTPTALVDGELALVSHMDGMGMDGMRLDGGALELTARVVVSGAWELSSALPAISARSPIWSSFKLFLVLSLVIFLVFGPKFWRWCTRDGVAASTLGRIAVTLGREELRVNWQSGV
ncbi:hypothetical protein B0H13DRAFT_1901520 [Mycena leptocephala]|nr:hypothetical protein B0H13DRAFT_1901520 [Mycena leptocephala]